ncbi:MAG: FAD-binding oxidoreductase [Acidimicrobiia bacterium]
MREAPPNPVPLERVDSLRFGAGVAVDDAFLRRLADVCAEVSVEEDERTESARDWWPLAMNWAAEGAAPARAAAVARPSSAAEVSAVLALCNESGVPVTAAAGRSGVCGSSIPVFGGVVLDMTGITGVVEVDDESLLLEVRSGTFGDDLERELREAHDVTLGHWPQSMALSTVGGWLACRSAGQYSTRYGKIEDMVVGLEVVMADGSVISTGGAGPRAAAGPDLNQLFVGSEGTLGVITSALLRLHPLPPAEARSAFGFASFAEGLDACRRILRRGATPAVLRLYDVPESKRNFDVATNALIVLDEGESALLDGVMSIVREECAAAQALDDALVARWLDHRNEVSALGALTSRGYVLDTVEIAGRWSKLAGLYEVVTNNLQQMEGNLAATAHQSHAYSDGACLYFTFAFKPEVEDREGTYRAAWDAVMQATIEHGCAISHHHGIGLNRGRFMRESLGGGFAAFESMKHALDANGILNPGKLGLPSPFGEVDF